MKDSWHVFTRDVKRILAVPRSLIIIAGILVTPALYTWLNILAFWDPYTETGNLPIAVVNNDRGTSSEITGDLNVGDMLIDQLSEDDQLGWEFLDEDTASERVRSGDAYASFVIPETFSKDLVDIFAGARKQPTIDYYVNEKKGAVTPKITDAGASALDIEITSAFRQEVGNAIVNALRDGGLQVEADITGAEDSASGALKRMREDLIDSQRTLDSADSSLAESARNLGDVRAALAAADPVLVDVSAAISNSQAILGTVVSDAQEFAVAASEASVTAQQALNQSSAAASVAVSDTTARITEMDTQLQAGVERTNSSIAEVREGISILEDFEVTQDLAAELTSKLDNTQELLDRVSQAGSDSAAAAEDLDALVKALDQALASTQGVANQTRDLAGQAVNTLTGQVAQMSVSLGRVDSAVASTRSSFVEVSRLVDGLEEQLGSAQGVLRQAQGNLGDLADSTSVAQTDVAALASALQDGTLETITGLDANNIGRYLASPVEFEQQPVFTVNAYGSGMAPMFINLSMWIGALILVIIFKVEVDKEGFEWLSVRSAYIGRFMLSGVLSMAQGLIVSVGSLLIGVQVASVPAFILTPMIIGPCYFAITYGLAAAFSHVGRALAILLVVLQIPGASGIYPIELMPGFFRALYPILPFSYGIDAIRETIGGFYDGRYLQVMSVLLLIGFSALVLGYLGRRHLGYFTRLFYDDLERTELVLNEKVELLGTRYRLSNIIALLSNRKEFSARVAYREEKFTARYPLMMKGFMILGALGLIALSLVANLTSVSKPGVLGLVAVWGFLIIGALVSTEALKSSIERASDLSHLSDDELLDSLERNRDLDAPQLSASEAQQLATSEAQQ